MLDWMALYINSDVINVYELLKPKNKTENFNYDQLKSMTDQYCNDSLYFFHYY